MTKKIKEMKNRRIRAENELMEEERIKRDEDKERQKERRKRRKTMLKRRIKRD